MAAGQHRHRAAFDPGGVRGLIAAPRESGREGKTRLAEVARQRASEFEAGAGGVARADDRDDRPHQHLERPAYAEQGRRIVKHREPRRISGFTRRNQSDAEFFTGRQFSARILLAADPPRTRCAAAPRQIGQPLQGRPRAAEMIDQRTKRAWPRYYGANATSLTA